MTRVDWVRDHYFEQSVEVIWIGMCSSCLAVHARGATLLESMSGEWVPSDPLGLERQRMRVTSKVRMKKPCGRVNGKWARHARGDNPTCTGLVFEEPDQEALLAAFRLGGHSAVVDMVDGRLQARLERPKLWPRQP